MGASSYWTGAALWWCSCETLNPAKEAVCKGCRGARPERRSAVPDAGEVSAVLQFVENNAVSLWCNYASGDEAWSAEYDTTFMDSGKKVTAHGKNPLAAIAALTAALAPERTP